MVRLFIGILKCILNCPTPLKVSKRVAGVRYAIRDVLAEARRVRQQGTEMLYLNIGDPVQYGFHPPTNVTEAAIKAIRDGKNYYGDSEGLPDLREAIAKKETSKGLHTSAEGILVSNGVSEALDMVMSSIIEEGDEVLLPGPYYPPCAAYIKIHGGVPVEFAVNGSEPDIDDIRSKITPKTVAISIASPGNPTGWVFDKRSLQQLADVAGEHDLYIISDEIYDRIVFDGEFAGVGSISPDIPAVILNGFSKGHLMTGWRIGYVAFSDSTLLDNLRDNVRRLATMRIAANLPVQYAALESLRGPQDYVTDFVSEVKRRRDIVMRRLDSIPGLSCSVPRGTFYAFPKIEENPYSSDWEFVMKLIRRGVLTVPGSGFGSRYGSGHFRLVFLPQPDILESALDKIEDFLRSSSTSSTA